MPNTHKSSPGTGEDTVILPNSECQGDPRSCGNWSPFIGTWTNEDTCLDAKDKASPGPETSHASALPFCSNKVQVLAENLCFLSEYKWKLQFDFKSLFQTKGF